VEFYVHLILLSFYTTPIIVRCCWAAAD